MKTNNLFGKIGIFISLTALFLVATYFGKAVDYMGVALFGLGILLGNALMYMDETFLYKYYDEVNKNLTSRSLLFLVSLPPLGLFLLTSTGSTLGVGMYLGIIAVLSLEMFQLRKNKVAFKQKFLFQLKRDITPDEHVLITTLTISLSILYAFLVIFLGR